MKKENSGINTGMLALMGRLVGMSHFNGRFLSINGFVSKINLWFSGKIYPLSANITMLAPGFCSRSLVW